MCKNNKRKETIYLKRDEAGDIEEVEWKRQGSDWMEESEGENDEIIFNFFYFLKFFTIFLFF